MNAIHALKTDASVFSAVWDGHKRAEFRRCDRKFAVGDALHLHEVADTTKPNARYTGRTVAAIVTHVQAGPGFAIPDGFAMLSFQITARLVAWKSPEHPSLFEKLPAVTS